MLFATQIPLLALGQQNRNAPTRVLLLTAKRTIPGDVIILDECFNCATKPFISVSIALYIVPIFYLA
jgi:hypothetical protein